MNLRFDIRKLSLFALILAVLGTGCSSSTDAANPFVDSLPGTVVLSEPVEVVPAPLRTDPIAIDVIRLNLDEVEELLLALSDAPELADFQTEEDGSLAELAESIVGHEDFDLLLEEGGTELDVASWQLFSFELAVHGGLFGVESVTSDPDGQEFIFHALQRDRENPSEDSVDEEDYSPEYLAFVLDLPSTVNTADLLELWEEMEADEVLIILGIRLF